ncbi:MAG: ATP-binding protein [Ferrimicrobium sp.]
MDVEVSELTKWLRLLDSRLDALVQLRLESGRDPRDPFRGLYLTGETIQRDLEAERGPLLAPIRLEADLNPDDPHEGRSSAGVVVQRLVSEAADPLELLRLRFGLEPLDCLLLMLAAAPEIDRRYGTIYAYLNDDVTRRRLSVGLALEVCGAPDADLGIRGHLEQSSTLVQSGLVTLGEMDAPFLRRSLAVDDVVINVILGGARHSISENAIWYPPSSPLTWAVDRDEAASVAAMLSRGSGFVYLTHGPGSMALALGVAAFAQLGLGCILFDLDRTSGSDDGAHWVRMRVRDARITGAGIIAGPIERLTVDDAQMVRLLADADHPIILFGQVPWHASWSRRLPHFPATPTFSRPARRRLLDAMVGADDDMPGLREDEVSLVDQALEQFTLRPEELLRVVRCARHQATASHRDLEVGDVVASARAQSGHGLERLTRCVHPASDWDQLVVPWTVEERLRSLANRARHRHTVIEGWGLRPGGARGAGVVGLFFGESGTGKTLAAEVIAKELGLDLYVVNLATVVDKYVGETEKNLEAIFEQAAQANGVLLFDEADALFGKRTEGGDAHDRYANIEVAYLLQKIESFDGLAILATNLRANMDPAFVRRIDVVVDFPMPAVDQRLRLWQRYLPSQLALDDGVDLGFLAKSFRLTGGSIQNICIGSAFDAYARDGIVTMETLVRATQRELEKLGRLCVEADFGPYFALIDRPMD